MADDRVFVANETYATDIEGKPYMIRKGIDRVMGGHPLVKQNPEYWDPAGDRLTYEVERATAEPGEKRGQQSTTISTPPEAVSHAARNDNEVTGHAVPEAASKGKGAGSTK